MNGYAVAGVGDHYPLWPHGPILRVNHLAPDQRTGDMIVLPVVLSLALSTSMRQRG